MARPTRSLFPPFAGVALADILANSAAIVIIMIVVTLMASHEQEEEKLEQAEDVAVLLSRELATSFVMNALPTSPPARLHDYVTWGPDRNPQHALMPILELHDGFVRDYYTGTMFPREELLRHDNPLDVYLHSLRAEQLAAVRIDVYSIREFYITMSILKAHGTAPRHWHFLSLAPGDASSGAGTFLAGRLRRDRSAPGLLEGETGAGSNPTQSTLPEDVALAGTVDSLERYPLDDLGLAGRFGGAPASEYLELPRTGATRTPLPSGDSRGTEPSGGASAMSGSGTTRFRVARAPGPETPSELTFDLTTALRGLFAFMKSVQADAVADRPSPLPDFDFERDILGRADEPLSAAEERLLGGLADELSMPVEDPTGTMTVVSRTAPDLRGQAMAVPVNRPLYLAVWLRGPEQPPRTGEEQTSVTLRLGLHPAIYEGLRVPLGQDGVILMPLPESADPKPRWRVVTLVNARIDDFVTGFVYAGLDDSGRLLLPVDENAVEIGGMSAESQYPVVKFRGEFLQTLFYGLVAALFALGIVLVVWRRA